MGEEAVARIAQVVVQHTGGDVRADVRVELRILDSPIIVAVGQVVVVPTAVAPLGGDQPVVGVRGLRVQPDEIERHGRFDVVPWIAVPPGEPGDHAGAGLQGSEVLSRAPELIGPDDAGDAVDRSHPLGPPFTA